jgi:hypothetical protein
MNSRSISEEFMEDLYKNKLCVLRNYILTDNTLMLAIRKDYINVYYRGGNIIKLTEKKCKHEYESFFDKKYTSDNAFQHHNYQYSVISEDDVQKLIDNIPVRKQLMDHWFTKNQKLEREFQQLVVRENNFSSISNGTEYFIADIEFAEPEIGARFDMLAFKWPVQNRKSGNVHLALIEMKYGDDALTEKSGIAAHVRDFQRFLTNPDNCKNLCDMAEVQINQLNKLGLLQHTKGDNRTFIVNKDHFEVIFIFANHNPRAQKLLSELENLSQQFADMEALCDIRFFVASSAGYGMHEACMKDLDTYKKILQLLHSGQK